MLNCRHGSSVLRVTGGIAKGITLHSPVSPGVRPTTDRVRTALFNILSRYGIEGVRVVDLFAGTGSLGIEALSRGADYAEFVEANERQAAVIRANLKATGFTARASVFIDSAERAVGHLAPCGLVLMDPPYAQPFPAGLIAQIGEAEILGDSGILVCGHAARKPADDVCGLLVKWDDRRYGDSALAFYSRSRELAQ